MSIADNQERHFRNFATVLTPVAHHDSDLHIANGVSVPLGLMPNIDQDEMIKLLVGKLSSNRVDVLIGDVSDRICVAFIFREEDDLVEAAEELEETLISVFGITGVRMLCGYDNGPAFLGLDSGDQINPHNTIPY